MEPANIFKRSWKEQNLPQCCVRSSCVRSREWVEINEGRVPWKKGQYFALIMWVLENSYDFFPCAIQRRNMSVLGISSPVSMLPSGSGKMWVRSVAWHHQRNVFYGEQCRSVDFAGDLGLSGSFSPSEREDSEVGENLPVYMHTVPKSMLALSYLWIFTLRW